MNQSKSHNTIIGYLLGVIAAKREPVAFGSMWLTLLFAFQKWRTFCEKFDNQVPDWNMGSLVRINVDGEISQDNTTIGEQKIKNV